MSSLRDSPAGTKGWKAGVSDEAETSCSGKWASSGKRKVYQSKLAVVLTSKLDVQSRTYMNFVWDPEKNVANLRKHGIDFETAVEAFLDPFCITTHDRVINGEERWHTVGSIRGLRIVLVAHTIIEEGNWEITRVISARTATKRERRLYEEEHDW